VFLNRRGYAPVLQCNACDWKSACPHCSAYRVFHKIDRSLRCHHCGFTEPVPRACPECGNLDIAPVGRGTERLQEHLASCWPTRPHGPARRAGAHRPHRRRQHPPQGSLQSQLAQVHAGEVDVLVGTQMVAKGHDFRRITLVAAVNPDAALFSSDFRAPERLFSLLMQAAGRAGRDAAQAGASEMWVQTFHPAHPLFEALKRHDYPAFAAQQLAERRGRRHAALQLPGAAAGRGPHAGGGAGFPGRQPRRRWDLPALEHGHAVPGRADGVQRVANVERAQMLVESPSRAGAAALPDALA
jgi:primosomal protein N' (replication factor Y)